MQEKKMTMYTLTSGVRAELCKKLETNKDCSNSGRKVNQIILLAQHQQTTIQAKFQFLTSKRSEHNLILD